MANNNSTEISTKSSNDSFTRKQKTLIVGPKKGITYFLARCAAIAIVFIRALPPISVGFFSTYSLFRVFNIKAFRANTLFKRLLLYLFAVEAIFYGYMQIKQSRMQKKDPDRVPTFSSQDRRVLFDRCLKSMEAKKFVEAWFEPIRPLSDLKRGNVQDLIAWSMFHRSNWKTEMPEDEKKQLEEFVTMAETAMGVTIEEGYNPEATFLKFTDEPVEGKHRPLVMYGIVHVLFQLVMAPVAMKIAGYRSGQEGSLTYWYRPGRNPKLPPIVFIHGIGIGILPYQVWFRTIEAACDAEDGPLAGRGILIPEIHVISQRLNPSDLHCDSFVPDIKAALWSSGRHDRACFVGHSYGTFCVSWILKRAPEIVAACGLLDPVAILLHSTDVLHNIVYHRALPNPVEAVLDYIMRSEVSLVHNLKREFFWFANILFLEEIDTQRCPTFICLGDTDQLVPIYEIRDYAERYNSGQFIDVPNAPHKPAAPVDILWFERCDHAGYIFNRGYEQRVTDYIGKVVGRSERMQAKN